MTDLNISPELSLLLSACLAEKPAPPPVAAVDWEVFIQLSRQNGVLALVADRLGDLAPGEIARRITNEAVLQAMHNLMAMRRMLEVKKCLSEAGVRAFPMKGPLWGWLYYNNTGLRSFGDLDFFIETGDLVKGVDALKTLGFRIDDYRTYLLSGHNLFEAYVRTDYQLALTPEKEGDVKLIELQWRNTYPRFGRFYTYTELMDRPSAYLINGEEVLIPRREYQFLMIIIHHGLIEQWARLKYLADLVFFLRKESADLDWDFIWSESQKKGLRKMLLLGLYLAERFSGQSYTHAPVSFETLKGYPFSALLKAWEEGESKSTTKSARIFSYSFRYKQGLRHKAALLSAHFSYLTEWKLLWHKARWYSRK